MRDEKKDMRGGFVLFNEAKKVFAGQSCAGQHDGKFVSDVADAKEFSSYGDAADFGQGFDDEWNPVDLFADDRKRESGHPPSNSYRYPY